MNKKIAATNNDDEKKKLFLKFKKCVCLPVCLFFSFLMFETAVKKKLIEKNIAKNLRKLKKIAHCFTFNVIYIPMYLKKKNYKKRK